jgi:excisionase family DNA binding protein
MASQATQRDAEVAPGERFFNTREVAEYLRLKERTVYELVRTKQIPTVRVAGKWLFPRDLIDRWLDENTDASSLAGKAPDTPALVAGSHDPLLEWAVRESGCGLATLCHGSEDGLQRVGERRAVLAAIHLLDAASGEYNVTEFDRLPYRRSLLLFEWARRAQGLVVAPGNPLGLADLAGVAAAKARLVLRPPGSGSRRLFDALLARAGVPGDALAVVDEVAQGEADVAEAVAGGRADVGLAIESVARSHRLDFVPLHRERVDLLVRRFDYFEPPVRTLMGFCATEAFRRRAASLPGYDTSALGRVVRNG